MRAIIATTLTFLPIFKDITGLTSIAGESFRVIVFINGFIDILVSKGYNYNVICWTAFLFK
jgi:hypothetical protein